MLIKKLMIFCFAIAINQDILSMGIGYNKNIDTTNQTVNANTDQSKTINNPNFKATDQRIFTTTGNISNSTVYIQADSAAVDYTKKTNSDNKYKLFTKFVQENKGKALINLKNLATWISENKAKTFFGAFGTTLIAMQLYLTSLSSKLNNNSSWSNWKDHKTIKDLHKIPQGELAKELLTDIQKNYIQNRSSINFQSALTNFVKETDNEEKLINKYKSVVKFIKTFHLDLFLFYNKKLFNTLNNRLLRLSFIKNNFLAWVSEHKIQENATML